MSTFNAMECTKNSRMVTTFCRCGTNLGGLPEPQERNARMTIERGSQVLKALTQLRIRIVEQHRRGYRHGSSPSQTQWADVQDDSAAKVAGARIVLTYCRFCKKDGFNPATWVLGDDVQLLASCADLQNDLAFVVEVVNGSSFWHRLRLQESCEDAFHKSANSSALRRVQVSRVQPQSGPFERHQWRPRGGERNAFER